MLVMSSITEEKAVITSEKGGVKEDKKIENRFQKQQYNYSKEVT